MIILRFRCISTDSALQVPDRQAGESKIAEPKALKEHISQARKVQPSVPQELTEYVTSSSPPAACPPAPIPLPRHSHALPLIPLPCHSHALRRYIVGAYVNMRAEEAGALASGADAGAQVLARALSLVRLLGLFLMQACRHSRQPARCFQSCD